MRLYKYISLEQFDDKSTRLDSYLDGKLFFASSNQFNDPWDALIRFETKNDQALKREIEKQVDTSNNALAKAIVSLDLPAYQYLDNLNFVPGTNEKQNLINTYLPTNSSASICYQLAQSIGICCLSSEKDNYLLWSHYSNSHSGICIGIEVDDSALHKVKYSSELPAAIEYLNPSFTNSDLFTNTVFDQLRTKSSAWSYENEYRLLIRERGLSGAVRFKIKEIIFGAKFERPDSLFQKISKKTTSTQNIDFYKVTGIDEYYKMEIAKWTPPSPASVGFGTVR